MASLACGMIAVASCNDDVTSTLLQTLMEKSEADLKDSYARFIALGLGLTYFGEYSSSSVIRALPLFKAYWLGMCVCANLWK